jgi:hypothetical protein
MTFDFSWKRRRPNPGVPPHDGPPPPPGDDEPDSERRPAARIRPVSTPSPGPAEAVVAPPVGNPPPANNVPAPRRSAQVVDPPPPRIPLAGRFSTAGQALRYLAILTASARDDDVSCYRGDNGWWIAADVELDLARTAADAARGALHIRAADGWTPDRRRGGSPGPIVVAQNDLTRVALIDLIAIAPLTAVAGGPLHTASVFLPAAFADVLIRRALDLGVGVSYRLVRLHPLFTVGASTAMAEVRLVREPDPIPPSLLAVGATAPLAIVCRTAGNDHLHIQHARANALPDQQLAALAEPDVWLLADAGFGCWRLQPLGRYLPGSALVVDPTAFAADVQEPHTGGPGPDNGIDIPRTPVRVIPRSTPGQRTDAVLLDDDDLSLIRLLLERHPLSESALVLRGRDRHLLTAAGGLLERLSVGQSLTCAGPGQLFLPVGHDFSPRLPASARRELFGLDPEYAVVVLDGRALRFAYANQFPVWCLWAGEPPAVEDQLPDGVDELLAQFRRPVRPPVIPPARHNLPRGGGYRTPRNLQPSHQRDWRDVALELEQDGQLVRAAEIHRAHNDPLRAARLFERAARHAAGT